MIEQASFDVEQGGVRLDAVLLSRYPTSTRAFCRDACASGLVKVNGRPATKGLKLHGGERIEVLALAEASDNRALPDKSVRLRPVFEDASLLAFDKPAGMPVQPLSRSESGTLANGVVARYPEVAEVGDQPLMAGALHRIDADTSGLVLVARSDEVFAAMRARFAAHEVKKTYLALVEGSIAAGGTLENDLVHDPSVDFCRMIDVSRLRGRTARTAPMHAVTNFKPIGRARRGNEELTLLEVVIYTGVTHQIRAQLANAGMHIVNDRLYGAFAVENQVGHCLHAFSVAFDHPVSGDPCVIETAYPSWAKEAIN